MADLHYFPLLAGDWLAGEAVSKMTPEQEGAFIHLLCHCWNSQGLPCTLPNDDKALAQLSRLGRRWARIGALIREQFREVDGEPARLYNQKLWTVYQDAKATHDRLVANGRKGGAAKAKGYQKPSPAIAPLKPGPSNQSQSQNQSQLTTSPAVAVAPKESRIDLLPKADCDALFEKWSKEIGAIPYPRFRKALLVVRSSEAGRGFALLELLYAIEAYGEWFAEQPDREQAFTSLEKTFVGKVGEWVRIGRMPLAVGGELTERGRVIGTKATRRGAA